VKTLRGSFFIKFVLPAALLLASVTGVAAQSTVFNIPATDVQSPGQVYLEANFIMHYGGLRDGGYRTYGPRAVVGLPGNTEVGVNVYYTRAIPAEPIDVQPNFKWQFYSNEKLGVALATGVLMNFPVTRRSEGTDYAQIYVVGSKSFSHARAPRVTFGGYRLVGSLDDDVDKSGVLLGVEQPITRKLSFVTDWSSGNNDFGYLVVGTGFTFSPKHLVYAGYNFGNQGRGNNSLGIFYGHTF
jgi:hypothetical protein